MDRDALIMMIIGMVVIWGGLVASIANAVLKANRNNGN